MAAINRIDILRAPKRNFARRNKTALGLRFELKIPPTFIFFI
jgi:hypothetical protein